MGTEGVPQRLSELPGALTCTVAQDSLLVAAVPGTDLRLLRARAEAVCAAAGDARSVVVERGETIPAAPAATSGAATAVRHAARPSVVASASALVLAFLAMAPDRGPEPVPSRDRAELAAAPTDVDAGAARASGARPVAGARRVAGAARGTTVDLLVTGGPAAEMAMPTSSATSAVSLLSPSTARRTGARTAAPDRPAPIAPNPVATPASTTLPPAPAAPAEAAEPVAPATVSTPATPTTRAAPATPATPSAPPVPDRSAPPTSVPATDGRGQGHARPADPPAAVPADPATPPARAAASGVRAGAARESGPRH